jgi:hypothetical protein
MAFTEGANDGALNGEAAVTIVAAPGASARRLVRSITICNVDTADVVVTVRYVNNASTRIIWSGTLEVGDTWQWGDDGSVIVLDTTTKSITAVMGGAAATTNPDFTAGYGDAT